MHRPAGRRRFQSPTTQHPVAAPDEHVVGGEVAVVEALAGEGREGLDDPQRDRHHTRRREIGNPIEAGTLDEVHRQEGTAMGVKPKSRSGGNPGGCNSVSSSASATKRAWLGAAAFAGGAGISLMATDSAVAGSCARKTMPDATTTGPARSGSSR